MTFKPSFGRTLLCVSMLCGLFSPGVFAQKPDSDSPLIRVGATTSTPNIDGKLDDAAWQQSVAISDFTVVATRQLAAEPTQVRFVYDPQNLYVAWRCDESLLTVAQQRMHEVKAEAKTHDSNVLGDDSVLMFLQPAADGAVYEFNLNSIGTLFDSRNRREELWASRDASWNAGATARAVQEDGFWTAELAIPWKAFGLSTPPARGASWQIALARRAVGRGESSSWTQNAAPAMHQMTNFGALVFDKKVPGIVAQPLPAFQAGKSDFSVQVWPTADERTRVDLFATLGEGDQSQTFRGGGVFAEPRKFEIPLTAKGDRPLFQWSAKGSREYYYRSPAVLVSARSTLAKLKISADKPWKLFINHKQTAADDSAQNRELSIPLVEGANDIVIETRSGAAKLELIPPGFEPEEKIAWRTAPAEAKALVGEDRSAWAIAPQQNGVVGTPGAPAYLQHTLLLNSTPIYPKTDPALFIAEGAAQQLSFLVEGVEGIPLRDWHLSLAVPEEIEIIGSSGFYHLVNASKPRFKTSRAGSTVINGKKLALYQVSADNPITYKKGLRTVLVRFEVLMRLAKSVRHDPQQQWTIAYWTRSNQGAISEAPHTIPVRTAPPINGRQPKKFVWELWSSSTSVYDDRSLMPDILDTARRAGFNKYLASSWKDFNDVVRRHGLKPFATLYFNDSRTMDLSKPYLAAHPEDKFVDKTGKRYDYLVCTTQVLGEAWPMFARSIQEWTREADVDAVEYDYEYPPFNPPHGCFCERCLTEFRKFSKLDAGLALTPEKIEKEYSAQWVDFMAHRTAILLGKIKAAVHEAKPGAMFTVYSGYYSDRTKSHYGIDWNLVGQRQAVDEAGMGYGRPVPEITESIAVLRGIPVKFGVLMTPYDERLPQPVAPLTQATLLRRALDATGGVLVYTRHSMDGRSWYAVGEITRLTADYEDVFLAHQLRAVAGQDPAKVQLLQGEKQSLLCLLNESSQPMAFKFRLPAELGAGREYFSGKSVAAGSEIEIEIPAGKTAVYAFGATTK